MKVNHIWSHFLQLNLIVFPGHSRMSQQLSKCFFTGWFHPLINNFVGYTVLKLSHSPLSKPVWELPAGHSSIQMCPGDTRILMSRKDLGKFKVTSCWKNASKSWPNISCEAHHDSRHLDPMNFWQASPQNKQTCSYSTRKLYPKHPQLQAYIQQTIFMLSEA